MFVGPNSEHFGKELTVTSPLQERYICDRQLRRKVWARVYIVEAPWMGPPPPNGTGFWGARPEHLRKRPGKQDWVRLGALDSAPKQLEPA